VGTGTGIFFQNQTERDLVEAVEAFEAYQGKFNPEYGRSHAARFNVQTFAKHYLDFLNTCNEKRPSLG
jgi:hypothetical protein